MEFNLETIMAAKDCNDESMIFFIEQFNPLMLKEASRKGRLDEECSQELRMAFVVEVRKFDFQR